MRIKLIEILKFLVAIAIGYTLRVMVENTTRTNHSVNFISKDIDMINLNLENIRDQLVQPYQPRSYNDLIEYRYFNLSVIFDTHLGQVESKIKAYHRNDLLDIIKQVRTHINNGQSEKFKVNSFLNGFERIDPVRGKEYILDLELVPEEHYKSPDSSISSRIHRLTLVKPFNYVQIVSQVDVTIMNHHFINLLYTFSDYHINVLPSLLHNYATRILIQPTYSPNQLPTTNVTLYFCLTHQKLSLAVNRIIMKFQKQYQTLLANNRHQIHIYMHSNTTDDCSNYSATHIRNLALKYLLSLKGASTNLILVNPNVNISYDFLQRCHSVLTDNADAFYVPIPFALYRNVSDSVSKMGDLLGEEYGLWDHNNYEVICLNKFLIDKAGYFNENESLDQSSKSLVNKLIKMKKEVFRSTDPSVRITYHDIKCSIQALLNLASQVNCEFNQKRTFQSKSENLKSINIL